MQPTPEPDSLERDAPHARGRHTGRERLTIVEHTGDEVPASLLTDTDLASLDMLAGKRVLTWRPTRTGYRIEAGSHVGVLVLDRVRLSLRPKMHISGEQIIDWLRFALGVTPRRSPARRDWHTATTGLPDLIVAALVDECRRLVRSGLRRDYIPEDRIEQVLRGRLDLRAQTAHRYGMVDQLYVRVHDRKLNVWENQVCRAALHAGARVTRDACLAREAVEVADVFPAHPHGRQHAIAALQRATYHRMNAGYRAAHAWANLLFGGGGPADLLRDADLRAGTLLIDMNRLWEGVVRRSIAEAAADLGGSLELTRDATALRVTVDGARGQPLRPDVLVRLPTEPVTLIAVDAKYKHAGAKAISSDDLHQLLTYATAYTGPASTLTAAGHRTGPATRPPRAMVVHPSEVGWTHHVVQVTGPYGVLGRILVVGADLVQPADEYRGPLSERMDQARRLCC